MRHILIPKIWNATACCGTEGEELLKLEIGSTSEGEGTGEEPVVRQMDFLLA